MKRFLFITLSVLSLSACASIMNTQAQKVTMRTPGAENAKCLLENQDMKYVIYTDETIEIMHSPHDLTVRCMAPGNRERTVIAEHSVSGWVVLDVLTGLVPGMAYDYFSRAAFTYPDELIVSFVDIPVAQYPLPDYEAADLAHNKEHNTTEYMGSTVVVTEETRGAVSSELQKRVNPYGTKEYTVENGSASVVKYDPREEDK